VPLSDLAMLLSIRGPLAAAEVRSALGVSAATLSRMSAAEPDLRRLGRARATRYALRRHLAGLPARLPVYRVDRDGAAREEAGLFPLVGGSFVEVLAGEAGGLPSGTLHVGLPPVLVDMAPAGYLGRRFAAQHAALQLPARLQDWSDDHRLIALARCGEDVPGDLVVGTESLDRFLALQTEEVRVRDYPRLAVDSAQGGAGSSAAGEQAKFTALRGGRHVLVKFTPGDESPSDLRWRDLLACEALALEALEAAGVGAARARVVDVDARRFLEVERFDRVGVRGRRGVLTLGPLDDELFGARDTWTDAAARLHESGLLDASDARRVRLLEAFGICIGNGDRHFGNLAFFADGLCPRPQLTLAPAYDMLPMDLAPRAGVVPPHREVAPRPQAKLLEVWDEALALAARFWARVREDDRISKSFRRAVRPVA
jgi:hypothetical protein